MTRRRANFKGIMTAVGHRAFDVAVLSAHHSWQAASRLGQTLAPRHLALRFERLRESLLAEAEIASRG